jgi:hypothetical protein
MRRRWIPALLAVTALVLAGCGGDDDVTEGGDEPPSTEAVPTPDESEGLDPEVLHIGEGLPRRDGDPAVRVLDREDPEAARRLFSSGQWDVVDEALADVDLTGRTLLGGLVHEGCFPAGDVTVRLVDDVVVFEAADVDEREGEVDCARAVVTAALVSVATDALPDGGPAPTPTTTTDPDVEVDGPGAGSGLLGEVLLIEPTGYEPADTLRPGLVRDPVDLEALFGRYDLGEPDPALRARVETGEDVLVAGVVGDQCTAPTDAYVSRIGDEVELAAGYGPEQLDDDTVCDALAQALVVVAVASDDVEGVRTVNGDPADGPTGVGVVHLVDPVDVGAEPLAAPLDDVDLATVPGAPATLDLPPVTDGAVRLVFVVEACQPDTAELVADLGAGEVRAEAQQTGARVDCDALGPHLVVADLAADHADLEPVAG